MASQQETDSLYMGTALLFSRLSKAKRAQVGSCLVTQHGIILGGVNGTAMGRPNDCETEELDYIGRVKRLTTKPEVIHAELNAILKAAKEGVSCVGATVYVTLSPCVPCSAMLVQAGVKRVVYKDTYRDTQGVELLLQSGLQVEQYKGG